jgi:nucleoside 2-deoxyribosyltransferase
MPITIIGGIYLERVTFPPDEVIYGSGGRAAFALKELDPGVSLIAYVGADRKEAIEFQTESVWKVPLEQYPVGDTVTFRYSHGLSAPVIRPTRLPLPDAPRIDVDRNIVLQFGMLEGSAVVHGRRVVFDPQNPESPRLFDANGSSAEQLAYVLNRAEASILSGETGITDSAKRLLQHQNVAVVVIKCGAFGSCVSTKSQQTFIPAYETRHVWPIGSGDVFAAVFAHFWAEQEADPCRAAELASRAAALYCASRDLPIVPADLHASSFALQELRPNRDTSETSIYLAGPFFTMAQCWLVEEARNALSAGGYHVFSPVHDVGIGDADIVVPQDIKALEGANTVLALCDGLDAGTLFEIGYAVKKGIPVVAFAEQASDDELKMLHGTGCIVKKDFVSAVYHAQWQSLR